MATFFTDFSEYSTGAIPSDFTNRWTTNNHTVADVSSDRLVSAAGGTAGQRLLSWDDVDSLSADVEVVAKIQVVSGSSSAAIVGLVVRGSGATAAATGYAADFELSTNLFRLSKWNAGTRTTLQSASHTLADSTWYWMRLRANSTTIQARYWLDGASEPGSWTLSVTDSAVSAAGWQGLHHQRTTGTRYWTSFGVGTAGATAPTAASSGYTLTPTAGSLALIGQNVTVTHGRTVTPSAAALALSGGAVTVARGRTITPTAAALSLSGQAVSFLKGRLVTPTAASLSLSGQSASLLKGRTVAPVAGTLAFSGQNVSLLKGRTITPQAASMALTGFAVDLAHGGGHTLTPQAGALALTGFAVDISHGVEHTLTPIAGGLGFSGGSVLLTKGRLLTPSAASMALSGGPVQLLRERVIVPASGALMFAGQAVDLLRGSVILPDAAALAFAGGSVTITHTPAVQPITAGLLRTDTRAAYGLTTATADRLTTRTDAVIITMRSTA